MSIIKTNSATTNPKHYVYIQEDRAMNADLSTMSVEMPKLIGLISKLTLFKQADSRWMDGWIYYNH